MNKNKVDIIVISYNTRDLALECVRSAIRESRSVINNVILVDNASTDGSVEALRSEFPFIRAIENTENRGFAAAVNQGFQASDAETVFVANTDIIFHKDTIETLAARLAENPSCGIVGGQQVFPNGKWQRSYGEYPSVPLALKDLAFFTHVTNFLNKKAWDFGRRPKRIKKVDYVDGALMAIRREAYDSVGGFDEAFFFYTEEADFCYSLKKAGYDVEYNPLASITHLRGGSSGESNRELIKKLFETKIFFLEKRYSKAAKRRFVAIETAHNYIARGALKFVSLFAFGDFRNALKIKLGEFEKYCAVWSEILRNS